MHYPLVRYAGRPTWHPLVRCTGLPIRHPLVRHSGRPMQYLWVRCTGRPTQHPLVRHSGRPIQCPLVRCAGRRICYPRVRYTGRPTHYPLVHYMQRPFWDNATEEAEKKSIAWLFCKRAWVKERAQRKLMLLCLWRASQMTRWSRSKCINYSCH